MYGVGLEALHRPLLDIDLGGSTAPRPPGVGSGLTTELMGEIRSVRLGGVCGDVIVSGSVIAEEGGEPIKGCCWLGRAVLGSFKRPPLNPEPDRRRVRAVGLGPGDQEFEPPWSPMSLVPRFMTLSTVSRAMIVRPAV
jgi:hypothetical protein